MFYDFSEIAAVPPLKLNLSGSQCLVGSARDEEPLVNAGVNWRGVEVLVLRNVGELLRRDTIWRVLVGKVGPMPG